MQGVIFIVLPKGCEQALPNYKQVRLFLQLDFSFLALGMSSVSDVETLHISGHPQGDWEGGPVDHSPHLRKESHVKLSMEVAQW